MQASHDTREATVQSQLTFRGIEARTLPGVVLPPVVLESPDVQRYVASTQDALREARSVLERRDAMRSSRETLGWRREPSV